MGGFGIFGLYLAGNIGSDWAATLMWTFSAGVLALREASWALGTWSDNMVEMDTTFADVFIRVSWPIIALLGLIVSVEIIKPF